MFCSQMQAYAPYERPALTKAYLFPLDKKPARLPVSMIVGYFYISSSSWICDLYFVNGWLHSLILVLELYKNIVIYKIL